MRIDSSGNVIIGETSAVNGGNITLATSAADVTISALCRSTTDSHGVNLIFQKSSTNSGNFAATADGENLGKIVFRGVNTSAVSDIGAQISVVQNGTSASTVPAHMIFTTNESERMRISSDGTVGIGNTTPGSFSSSANNLVIGTGSGSQGMTIFGGNESNIFFSDGTGAPQIGRIEYSHIAEDMKFYVNNHHSFNITGSKVDTNCTLSIDEVIERVAISATTSNTINTDLLSSAVVFYNVNQTANRTINFRGDSSTSLNNTMAIGESMTCAIIMQQGSTAYYLNAYQIDGSSVTPKWQGGSAPTGGNASSIDAYSFTIIKTADATFTVLASITQYA